MQKEKEKLFKIMKRKENF